MLYPYSAMGNLSVFRFLLGGEFSTAWLFVWHRDRHTIERKTNKAQVLQHFTAVGQRIGCLVSNRLIVATPFVGITQKRNLARFIAKQHVLYGVALFLAAIVRFLLSIVMRTGDWSFTPIVIKRGVASSASSVWS